MPLGKWRGSINDSKVKPMPRRLWLPGNVSNVQCADRRLARLRQQLAFHINVAARHRVLVEKVFHRARAVLQLLRPPYSSVGSFDSSLRVAGEESTVLAQIQRYGWVSAVKCVFLHVVCYQTQNQTQNCLCEFLDFSRESEHDTNLDNSPYLGTICKLRNDTKCTRQFLNTFCFVVRIRQFQKRTVQKQKTF